MTQPSVEIVIDSSQSEANDHHLIASPAAEKGKGGGPRRALASGIGAAMVLVLLPNVEALAERSGFELPLGGE